MSNTIAEIRFVGQEEYLSIAVEGRAYHRSQDFWDGNWLLVQVSLKVGKFSGLVPGTLRAEELRDFSLRLQAFDPALVGVIAFNTAERWLSFEIEANRVGQVMVSGRISDGVADGNALNFHFASEPALLNAPLSQLEHVVELFPVIGAP